MMKQTKKARDSYIPLVKPRWEERQESGPEVIKLFSDSTEHEI